MRSGKTHTPTGMTLDLPTTLGKQLGGEAAPAPEGIHMLECFCWLAGKEQSSTKLHMLSQGGS